MRTSLLIVLLIPSVVTAAEFKLVHRIGEPNPDHEKAWNGHVDHASWVDDERIVFWSKTGKITCLEVSMGRTLWSLDRIEAVDSWSISPATKRLAYGERSRELFGEDKGISVIDCATGKRLAHLAPSALARLFSLSQVLPGEIALSPVDARLMVCHFSSSFGRNGYSLDPTYQKVESSFEIDASPREASLSPEGRFLSLVAHDQVLCVRDLKENRELFFQGKRVLKRPESITVVIDAPFFSHIRSDGRTAIYTEDNSWGTGKVFVHDLAAKSTKSFDARNGHIEIDVNFASRRLVLTGTEAGLTLMDFDGTVLSHLKDATQQRNLSVEFSPSGKRVVVGSWDNAVYVYEIVE